MDNASLIAVFFLYFYHGGRDWFSILGRLDGQFRRAKTMELHKKREKWLHALSLHSWMPAAISLVIAHQSIWLFPYLFGHCAFSSFLSPLSHLNCWVQIPVISESLQSRYIYWGIDDAGRATFVQMTRRKSHFRLACEKIDSLVFVSIFLQQTKVLTSIKTL